MAILKMKVIKSNYDFKTDMYNKYFPILEKVAESTGTTLILVRNHFPILYYCSNSEVFENEAETGNWKRAYPSVLLAPDAYNDKLHFIISYEKEHNEASHLEYAGDKALEDVIKTFRTGILKVKNYQVASMKRDIEKDFCEVENGQNRNCG